VAPLLCLAYSGASEGFKSVADHRGPVTHGVETGRSRFSSSGAPHIITDKVMSRPIHRIPTWCA
jgi:hypothetical protein